MEGTTQPTAPVEEQESSVWEKAGFISPLARLCTNLEALPEKHFVPRDIKQAIERLTTGKKVEDFEDLTRDDLNHYRRLITRELPRYYQEVTTIIRSLSRVRTIVSDDDFI